MNLHKNKELFLDAIAATAQRYNIPEIYIEKDYWVTVALYAIFHSEIADQAVFKGGTALSKCYKLVERFSEDVDIVVLQNEGESANKLKTKLKAITEVVNVEMPEIEIPGITNKMGQIRKTAHQYSRENLKGTFGQVREHIILEASWLGSSEPYTMADVSCYIVDMMSATGQAEMIEQYNLQPFTVRVLSKERTLCEKIMSLVRFSHTENPYTDLSNKIRHIYDIHMMLKDVGVAEFFDSEEFDKLLLVVGHDDVISFKNNNEWLKNHPKEAVIFSSPAETWEKIKTAYNTSFKNLVMGDLPPEGDLVITLKRVTDRLINVAWSL
jgi:predicted nucleotidyltransferase component of viral defense system